MRVTVHRAPGLDAAHTAAVRAARLAALLRDAGRRLAVPERAGLAVRLTDDSELQRLNREHLGVDASTDVLAFPGDDATWVGDIAISVEHAAAQRPGDVAGELRLLAIHGLLHCLGHDHADGDSARAMTAATRDLLPGEEIPELVAP